MQMHKDSKRSKSWEAAINIISCIVGSGIVSLPCAVQSSGLALGLLAILAVGIAIDFSLRLLILAALELTATSNTTYPKLMNKLFGRAGSITLSVCQLLVSFGGVCIDLIMIGDNLSNLLFNIFLTPGSAKQPKVTVWVFVCERYFLVPVIGLGVILPLSLIRHVRDFAKVSVVAVSGSVLLVIGVFAVSIWGNGGIGRLTDVAWVRPRGLYDTVHLSLAFICHGVAFSIYNSLKIPSMRGFASIVHFSVVFSYLIFAIIGVPGYLRFGDEVDGNILNNFPYENTLINVLRVSYTISLITSMPLEIFIMRQVLLYYRRNSGERTDAISTSGSNVQNANTISNTSTPISSATSGTLTVEYPVAETNSDKELGTVKFNLLVSCTVTVLATLVAVSMQSVKGFLNITGGVACTCIGLVFPAACFLRATGKPWSDATVIGSLALLGFGLWIFAYSLVDCWNKLTEVFTSRIVKF